MRFVACRPALLLVSSLLLCSLPVCSPASAGGHDELPIRSGRWSSGSCSRQSEASTRFFRPGWTSTLTNRCALFASREGVGTYRAHLTCPSDQDDVVLKLSSPTSLTWINQCLSVEYRFCQ